MKRSNDGFSLVELIVVLAVMMVLATGATMSINALSNREAKAALEHIDSSLQYVQGLAMSKTVAYGQIVVEDGSYYFCVIDGTGGRRREQKEKLGSANSLQISYTTTGGAPAVTVDESHPLLISFDKASGALSPMISQISAQGEIVYQGGEGAYAYCNSVTVKRNSFTGTVKIYPKTGKHELVM